MKGGIEEGLCATACGQPVGSFASRPPHGLPIWTTADAFPLPRQKERATRFDSFVGMQRNVAAGHGGGEFQHRLRGTTRR